MKSRLIPKTSPKARKENMVFAGKYRVTVLTDSLFRIEENPDGNYCDETTQVVWFRNLPAVSFKVKEEDGKTEITTEKVTLVLTGNLETSYVLINGEKIKISNKGNLLGTYRTLDRYNGDLYDGDKTKKIQLEPGVVSRTGVAVLDDSASLIIGEDGMLHPRTEEEKDIYVFAYKNRYREAVKALYAITGNVPQIPRFALGNWWSRYHRYSDKEYLHLMADMKEENIPITVGVIDMDWHWSSNWDVNVQFKITESGKDTDFYGYKSGWTGFTWNTELFPDYKDTLKKIHDYNVKIALNLHPASGVRFFEKMYKEVAEAVGIDPKTEERVQFDMTNEKFIQAYFDYILNPYEKDGVDFWWIDWQQGQKTSIPGLDPLWLLNHYQYLDIQDKACPVILSRYGGLGSHRYPIGFSGDAYITWDTLKYQPTFTMTASNAGYSWWSHDIGGHMRGAKDDELFVRFLQLGVFSPINRLHCSYEAVLTKEPNVFMNGTGYIAKEFLRLRHRLIPYLYTASYENTNEGLALVEPVYYAYPEKEEAYHCNHEYFYGRQLLVTAVTTKGTGKDRLAKTPVWLPEGHWTDFFTGDEYDGEKTVDMYRWMDSIPVLAKEGAIVPLDHRKEGNDISNPSHLDVCSYLGNGSYTLVEDSGKKRMKTVFVSAKNGNTQSLHIETNGDREVLPVRTMTVYFKNIFDGTVIVSVNGKKTEAVSDNNHCLTVELTDMKAEDVYDISVVLDENRDVESRQVLYTLKRLCGDTTKKNNLYNSLHSAQSREEKDALIDGADFLSASGRGRLHEVIDK